jgi:putative transposase
VEAPACGYCAKENRKSQAKFLCLNCGLDENADSNASKNIKARAEQSDSLMFRSAPALLA